MLVLGVSGCYSLPSHQLNLGPHLHLPLSHGLSQVQESGPRNGQYDEAAEPEVVGLPLAANEEQFGRKLLQGLLERANSHPTLSRREAIVSAQQGNRIQVALPPNPQFGYISEDVGEDGSSGRHGVYLVQRLVRDEKFALRGAVADAAVEVGIRQLTAQQARIATDVQLEFIEFVAAVRQEKLAKELQALATKYVVDTSKLLEGGDVRQAELYRAQAEAGSFAFLVENAVAARQAAWQRLILLTGAADFEPPELVDELSDQILRSVATRRIDRESLRQRLQNEHPELALAEARVEQARWQIESSRAEGLPDMNLQVALMRDAANGDTISGVQFGMWLPMYNWNQGNIMQAESRLIAAEHQVEATALRIQRQFESVYQQYVVAAAQIRAYESKDGILAKTLKMLELMEKSYRGGETRSIEMLTAQRANTQARLAHLGALRRAALAILQLDGLLMTGSDTVGR